ncbi:hypothetical protein L484_023684 [Morus notabilis]|uniref:Uncharacterized protein n=1 Tax=Morus notabilis TaxID=981085 RepID=W9RDV9_9ROSA|nr:hypothetical protein L484_023684 [Morus notabilis]
MVEDSSDEEIRAWLRDPTPFEAIWEPYVKRKFESKVELELAINILNEAYVQPSPDMVRGRLPAKEGRFAAKRRLTFAPSEPKVITIESWLEATPNVRDAPISVLEVPALAQLGMIL